MSSVREIAKRAGVSITTVSRVLNSHPTVSDSAREKVLSAVNDVRYVHAVGRRSTANIAFAYTGVWSLGSPFDAGLMQGMSTGMYDSGFDLLVLNATRATGRHESYSQMFMSKGVRGAILRTTEKTRDVCVAIAAEGFPAVVVADEFDESGVSCVSADSRAACRRAFEHLLDLGHRRIAFALNVLEDHDHRQRLEAYHEALHAAGLPADERLILRVHAIRDAGATALRQLMAMRDRPTAIFMADPLPAVGLMREAERLGINIPNQLSVIGIDDGDVRLGTHPRMTSVCADAEAMGSEAFESLQMLMDNPGLGPQNRRLKSWLEIHESTAKPS